MRTFAIVLGTIALAVVLVTAGIWLGVTWTQGRWGYGMMAPGMMGGWGGYSRGSGMMGSGMMGSWSYGGSQGCAMMGLWGGTYPEGTETLTMEEAEAAVGSSLKAWNNDDLAVREVMEFSNHFYAIVQEKSTGIGAFEVLVDKVTGAVSPEPGPNMMWNLKYGMMGGYGMGMMGGYGGMMGGGQGYGMGMMGGTSGPILSPDMPVDEAQAIELAQKYLDTARPGTTADEEADAFYGYYTLHVLNDGEVTGMLSVNGYTGQVWYHTWHAAFVGMAEH